MTKTYDFIIEKEAFLSIKDTEGKLHAVVFTSPTTRNKVFYTCSEMGIEQIEAILQDIAGQNAPSAKSNKIKVEETKAEGQIQ